MNSMSSLDTMKPFPRLVIAGTHSGVGKNHGDVGHHGGIGRTRSPGTAVQGGSGFH